MTEKFNYSDLELLAVELPHDVKSLHYSGNFTEEIALIDRLLAAGKYGDTMCRRLKLQKFIAAGLDYSYTLTKEDVLAEVREKYPAFDEETLDRIREIGHADYILKNGVPLYQNAAGASILTTCDPILRRLTDPGYTLDIGPNENARTMREKGSRSVRYTVRESIRPADHCARDGAMFRAWLPFPCDVPENTDRKLLSSSHEVYFSGCSNGTVYAEFPWEGRPFEIELSFTCNAVYHELSDSAAKEGNPGFYLGEDYPHIVFTPYLR